MKIIIWIVCAIIVASSSTNCTDRYNHNDVGLDGNSSTGNEDVTNKIKIVKVKDDYSFELIFKPANLMALQELRNKSYSNSEFDSVKAGYEGMNYFTFSIRPDKSNMDLLNQFSSDKAKMDSMINYFAFYIQDDLNLISSQQDTLKCKLFHFERSFGASPFIRFNLAFDKDIELNSSIFNYSDKVLGVGIVDINLKNLASDI